MEGNSKRSIDNDDHGEENTKKLKLKHGILCSKNSSTINLTDLCDDVIMHIFKFLSHDNLANMSLVCSSLSRISKDWTLWKNVYFAKYEKSMEDVYLSYLKECTTNLIIKGVDNPQYNTSISYRFLSQLEQKCPELNSLSLHRQKLNASEINIKMFHRGLKTLKIKDSIVENIPENTSYLCGLNNFCPNLEIVKMQYNDWFMPPCLYALAKLEKLKYLSLKGCKQFKDCIPYASITTITGFKYLQTLDLRLTPISDHELVCFQRLKELKNVFLESPPDTDHNSDATISDLGLSRFCNDLYSFHNRYIRILIGGGEVNLRRVHERIDQIDKSKLKKLIVRNYPKVTDAFLKSAAKSCPYIEALDVTGTSCSSEEIERYKAQRPNVDVVC
ncbi:uncharacterized protein LOC126897293 [Daktulosphaira vitifoliae]|uniref:uncharacterized protein LOC126897293 n=1 Tax=Daktulosphaira vitifoliae TaxID=58002 RepID=UPI0021AA7D75|nr:uncharacterized protein LOC126897293 [Daktulosphaira vitifoliae]